MNFRFLITIASAQILLLFTVSAEAQKINTDFGGYVKELASFSISNDLNTFRFDNIVHHRLESRIDVGKDFEVRVDIRNRLLNGYNVQNNALYAEFLDQDNGYFDLSRVWIENDRMILHSVIDRMQLSYIHGPWEVHAGRQRINWSKSMVWNPNDLFNTYAFLDFDYEERPGTDAIYGRYSWSYASSVEAGFKFGDQFDESVLAAMYRGNIGDYDIQVIAGSYYQDLVLGLGWSGYLKNAGFKGELSYFHSHSDIFNESGVLTSTIGMDYMFSNSVYVTTELLYNGGFERSSNAVAELTQPPSANDLFIAKTGYYMNAAYPITPLTNINVGIMGSFDRSLVIFIPQVTHSLSENLDLLILAQSFQGQVISDITETPNVFFFRLKYSY